MRLAVRTDASYADYLEHERATDQRHEFLAGAIYAMAGGTPEHGYVCANVIRLLGGLVGERPCLVGTSDVKVRVEATGLSTYPDALVRCGDEQRSSVDRLAVTNPVVLVEVLSDATEAYDRGAKFAHYRRIPALREYVLVAQSERRVEVFHRSESGVWSLDEAVAGGAVRIASLDGVLKVDDVYRGVVVPGA